MARIRIYTTRWCGYCVRAKALLDSRGFEYEEVEEAREGAERALVRLGFAEEAEHRLGPDHRDVQAVVVLARLAVGAEELDAGDRLQLARSLVEHQLDVRERLEARPEARLRLADALRDRADPPAVGRVEVEDPVGLGEAHRPEHDRLGLVGAPGHCSQSRAAFGESWLRRIRCNG